MAWKIDRDYLAQEDPELFPSAKGTSSTAEFEGDERFRFRILDDDGEVYYGGVFDRKAAEIEDGEPGSLYEALQWAQWHAGATDLQLHGADAANLGVTSSENADKEWVSIFG